MRILIVDDDHDFAESLSEVISIGGHVPIIARNGQQAIKIFKEEDIDLLLIDIKMPGINGVDTFKEVRRIINAEFFQSISGQDGLKNVEMYRRDGVPKVPIYIITAYADEFKAQLDEIVSNYRIEILRKPFGSENLLNKIELNAQLSPAF